MKNTISTMHSDGFNYKNQFAGTYLHGQIETDYEFDIFSFDNKVEVGEGIHNMIINDKKCVFFVWSPAGDISKRPYQYRGFLVYRDDLDAMNHALQAYIDRKDLI